MKSKKKLIAILLALVLLIAAVTVVSFTVFAEDGSTDSSSTQTHTHTWEVIKVGSTENEPTAAVHYKKCASCGDTTSESHTWQNNNDGTGTCSVCGYVYSCTDKGHQYGSPKSYDSSAAAEDGTLKKDLVHYCVCKVCGEQTDFAHHFTPGWQTDDTGAYHWRACDDCDVKIEYGYHIDSLESDKENHIEFKNPYGETESNGRCDVCDAELQHRYKLAETQEATCTSNGKQIYICTNCLDKHEDILYSTGHYWTDDEKYCKYEWSDDKESCTLTFTCMNGCGATLVYNATRSGDTDNVVTTKEKLDPTCTKSGYITYQATFTIDDITSISGWHCSKDVFTTTATVDVASTGHKLKTDANGDPVDKKVTKEATCKEDEVFTGICANCGEPMTNQTLVGSKEKVDHTPGKPTSASETFNCQEGGTYVSVTTCTVCGKTLKEEKITVQPKDHTMEQFEDVVEATCFKDGTKTTGIRCSVCGYVESSTTVTIKSTGHDVKAYTSSIPATCTEAGRLVGVCEKCGSTVSIVNENDPAKGHTLSGSTAGKGCYQQCEVCGVVTRDSKNHVDLDFNLVCDNCHSEIKFLPNALHYLSAWPMYWLRLIIHKLTGTPIV